MGLREKHEKHPRSSLPAKKAETMAIHKTAPYRVPTDCMPSVIEYFKGRVSRYVGDDLAGGSVPDRLRFEIRQGGGVLQVDIP